MNTYCIGTVTVTILSFHFTLQLRDPNTALVGYLTPPAQQPYLTIHILKNLRHRIISLYYEDGNSLL